MKYLRVALLLAVLFLVSSVAFAAEVTMPSPQVEAETAQRLLDIGIKLHKQQQSKPSLGTRDYDFEFTSIARSLAQLGRTETALKVAKWTPSNKELPNEIRCTSAQRSALAGDVEHAEKLISEVKNYENIPEENRTLLLIATIYILQDNLAAAQKVLFEAEKLNEGNSNELLKIAYLFSAAGNRDKALRVFREAEKSVASNNPVNVEIYLLRADFIDEWKKFHYADPNRRAKLDGRIMEILLKSNRIDALVDAAEFSSANERAVILIQAAYQVSSQNPSRAKVLLDQAQEMMPEAIEALHRRMGANRPIAAKDAAFFPTILSWGFDKIGDHENAEKWRREMEKQVPDTEREEKMFIYYLMCDIIDQ